MESYKNRRNRLNLSECREILEKGLERFFFSREAMYTRRSLKEAYILTLKSYYMDVNKSASTQKIVPCNPIPTYNQFRYVKDLIMRSGVSNRRAPCKRKHLKD